MEELFGNLIYLIPVALVIFRVLTAITGSKKKRQAQKEAQSRETPQSRSRTETADPVMRELLKQFGVSPESAGAERAGRQGAPAVRNTSAARNTPHWEREKKPVPQKKKPSVHQPLPAAGFVPVSVPLSPADSGAARNTANTGAAEQSARVFAGLNPIQQGFVWAELLGQPRAMQPFG